MSGKETDFPKAVPGKLEKLGHHLLLGPKELTRFTKREIKDPFACTGSKTSHFSLHGSDDCGILPGEPALRGAALDPMTVYPWWRDEVVKSKWTGGVSGLVLVSFKGGWVFYVLIMRGIKWIFTLPNQDVGG